MTTYRSFQVLHDLQHTYSGVKSMYRKISNQKLARQPKCCPFFLLLWASSKLCDSFTLVFLHKTAAFYTEQSSSPSLFTTSKAYKVVQTILMPFSKFLDAHLYGWGTNEA